MAAARASGDDGAVLLKNQGSVPPLSGQGKRIAVIGPAADDGGAQNAYQGAGSAHVPLFGTKASAQYVELFRQIVNLAPPPIGVGAER